MISISPVLYTFDIYVILYVSAFSMENYIQLN